MKTLAILLMSSTMALLFAGPARAQSKFELFGGYSNVTVPVVVGGPLFPCSPNPPSCPPAQVLGLTNANGWEISGVWKTSRWLGLKADFDGHYTPAFGGSASFNSFLFGPQISAPGRISPFAHVLLGVSHQSQPGGFSANTLATAIGGGVDFKVSRFVSLRIVQADYYLTRYLGSLENEVRFSTGVVLHF